ncbi:MAG TPA: hypothetical protein VN929_17100 [Burkholderiales bacterium]|nr:hypothetical protein [Burkholderiales bacterium]
MAIDWNALATIAAPIIALFLGVWIDRWFESRARLISYFGHVASFQHAPANAPATQVNTHQVVLRNAGRRAATNIRLTHQVLPSFITWPMVVHHVAALPNGQQDIVIPTLVPGEQITISYLYFPPVTVAQVNAGIKCDQGFATPIPVLLQRQFPLWVYRLTSTLKIAGLIAIIYLIYSALSAALRWP